MTEEAINNLLERRHEIRLWRVVSVPSISADQNKIMAHVKCIASGHDAINIHRNELKNKFCKSGMSDGQLLVSLLDTGWNLEGIQL